MGGELASWFDWSWIQFGPLGTWVSAAATVAAFIWAITQTLKTSRETNDEKRTAHAQQISAWHSFRPNDQTRWDLPEFASDLYLGNSSTEPVYGVVAYLVWVQGAAYSNGEDAEEVIAGLSRTQESSLNINHIRAVVQVLPPGRFAVILDGVPTAPAQGQLGVEVAFTDRAGRHWVRRADGKLEGLSKPPIDHYGIVRPVLHADLNPRQ